jgi:hypothetical protein
MRSAMSASCQRIGLEIDELLAGRERPALTKSHELSLPWKVFARTAMEEASAAALNPTAGAATRRPVRRAAETGSVKPSSARAAGVEPKAEPKLFVRTSRPSICVKL